MTELFPTSVRGVAQGFCYNVGRGIGALFPALVGILADRWAWATPSRCLCVSGLLIMILALMTLAGNPGKEPGQRRTAGPGLSHRFPVPSDPGRAGRETVGDPWRSQSARAPTNCFGWNHAIAQPVQAGCRRWCGNWSFAHRR